MFDEEGRKIDFGLHIGMSLDGMSVTELQNYIQAMNDEIERVTQEITKREQTASAADALFK